MGALKTPPKWSNKISTCFILRPKWLVYLLVLLSNYVSSGKLFIYFCIKKYYFFCFTNSFLQNIHINLSILHIYSIRYSLFYNFLLFPHSLLLSLTNPTLPKNTKILDAQPIVTVHICTVTVTLVHLCIILHLMMWIFFCSKCVKLTAFCILQNYAQSDAITLPQYFHNRSYFINYY